jgi:[ribosomal protein S5]-alanine N-acetyltransferase
MPRAGARRARVIVTERLRLVPATPALVRAALAGPQALAAALGTVVPGTAVPPTWPHQYLDRPALEFTLERVSGPQGSLGWWMHFVILVRGAGSPILIGTAGYKGPVGTDGSVEVGYGIVSDHQRRGYASEAVRGLLAQAFAVPEVRRVIGETLPELVGSIGVMRTCGFHPVEGGSEPGVIRFAIDRAQYAAAPGGGARS